jgi:hypothetical protein
MKKTVLLVFLVLIFTISALCAMADSSELNIDRVEVTVDGDKLLTTSNSGSIDVKPGDELYIEIRLENTFDDDTDMRMDDIRVTATIEDIDDGSSISDESDRVYIRANSKRTVRLKLTIPDDASSYQDYDLDIKAVGYDEDGALHEDEVSIDLDVEREEHKLMFNRLWVNDVACDGEAAVRLELENIGEEYEDDVELSITSAELGTLFLDRFDLPSVDDDDSDLYRKEKQLDVSELKPGLNSLTVRVEYDDGDEVLQKKIDFRVDDCRTPIQVAEDREEKVLKTTEPYTNPDRDTSRLFGKHGEVEVVLPDITDRAPTVPTPPPRESWFSTFVLFLADIAIMAFIILLVRAKNQ